MKLYLVIGTYHDTQSFDEPATYLYGVFSTRDKAEAIAADIRGTLAEDNSDAGCSEELKIEELILDETTEDYDLAMSI